MLKYGGDFSRRFVAEGTNILSSMVCMISASKTLLLFVLHMLLFPDRQAIFGGAMINALGLCVCSQRFVPNLGRWFVKGQKSQVRLQLDGK